MKKILLATPYFILWIFYFFLTINERDRYIVAESKGMACTNSYDSSRLIYGTTTTYEFDANKKPVRNFLTWKQFWKARGY
jgi:hypothetical protein